MAEQAKQADHSEPAGRAEDGAARTGQVREGAWDGGVAITSVRVVGVPVSDQERALDFFTRVLGFEKRIDSTIANFGRWIVVGPAGSDIGIGLVPAGPGLPAGVETGIRFGAADVEAAHAAMTARGVDADPVLHWEGAPPMYAFRDVDGNGYEIIP